MNDAATSITRSLLPARILPHAYVITNNKQREFRQIPKVFPRMSLTQKDLDALNVQVTLH